MQIDLSANLTPGRGVEDVARAVEELGYRRIWMNDSPALYADVWMSLLLCARDTRDIGLSVAVVVPRLRHVVCTASAITTLCATAPGRVSVALGRGLTGALAVGERPNTWVEVRDYLLQLRSLLAGDTIGDPPDVVSLLQEDRCASPPVAVPLLIAANGPVGVEVARSCADGIISNGRPAATMERTVVATTGTVFREGEGFDSPRVLEAAGPGVLVQYRSRYYLGGGTATDGAAAWAAYIDGLPASERRAASFRGHAVRADPAQLALVSPDAVASATLSGPPETIVAKLRSLAALGATEVIFRPVGDVVDELARLADATGLRDGSVELGP